MANEKRTCNQICRWNDSSDGCIKPYGRNCPMSNTEPDASGWGQAQVANEKRLIDAKPIMQFIVDGLNNPNPKKAFGYDAIQILAEIEYAPTVDAVEVVRCEKCRYFDKTHGRYEHLCSKMVRYMRADHFCSYGERREGE